MDFNQEILVETDDLEQKEVECDCRSIFIRHGVHQDQGRRSSMEDKHVIDHHFNELVATAIKHSGNEPVFFPLSHSSVYFGLFDGHAGVAAAEFCKRNLHRNIAHSIPSSSSMGEAMAKGFLLTDRQFLDTARLSNEESGSVCVSIIYSGDTLHIAHTGDSRAVLCRDSAVVYLTSDHKPTSILEKARVEQNGGTVEWDMLNGVLEVSRAIGDFDRDLGLKTRGLTALPETQLVKVHSGDEFLIVACDGLWDVINCAEAIRFTRAHLFKYDSVKAASEFLVREALRRQSDDNITVIIIGFSKRDPATSTDRIIPSDAIVDDELPPHAHEHIEAIEFWEEPILEETPNSGRRRPRFCSKGLAQVRGLLC